MMGHMRVVPNWYWLPRYWWEGFLSWPRKWDSHMHGRPSLDPGLLLAIRMINMCLGFLLDSCCRQRFSQSNEGLHQTASGRTSE